jgi:hypothetical protein
MTNAGAGGRATSKMTPERVKAVLDGLRLGLSRTIAANAVGISKTTITNWAARSEPFRAQLEQAEAEAERTLIGLIVGAAAKKLPTSWQAAAWILERTRPDRYGQRSRVDLSLDVRQAAEDAAADMGVDPAVVIEAMEEELRKRSGQG